MFYSTINAVFEDSNGRRFGIAILDYDHISRLAQLLDRIHIMRMFGCKYITTYVVIDNE